MELVSIITPSYNSARFIAETIESVMTQTYQNWEMLITDDCSSDGTVDIVKYYCKKDARIKLFVLERNSGAAIARNNSIKHAKGKYIAFLDSDDIWLPQKLEKQIRFMDSNNYAFSMTAYSLMDLDGKSRNKILYMPKSMSYAQYLRNTAIGCLTVVIDKEKTGAFEMPNIRTSQDMALWLVILKRGFKIYALNENLASYRLVPTSNSAKKMKAIKDVWRVYRELERLSFIYAAFNFCGYMFHAILKRI